MKGKGEGDEGGSLRCLVSEEILDDFKFIKKTTTIRNTVTKK